MRALDRKLLRETRRLKGQIATIAIVLASGIASFIMLRGTFDRLEAAREAYYDNYRFAHVFATLERAPESLKGRIETLPGVRSVQTRISKDAMLPMERMLRPAYARVLSLPGSHKPATNAVHLDRGRLPQRGREDEVLLLEAFAEAHGLDPGDRVPAVINGRLRRLLVVGIARSPEFVYAIQPGASIADPKRAAVLWMDRFALASLYQFGTAFNDVSLRLQPGASEAGVLLALDRILKPYGGDGAVARKDQISNRIVTGEMGQLGSIAGMVPLVFLGVAVFLIRLVLGRLVSLQRPEIATLKALGYSNRAVGRHYLGLVAAVMVPGSLLGVFGGWALGGVVLRLYQRIFHFPDLSFRLTADVVAISLVAGTVAALAGALLAVRAAVNMPPAEAMRPPAPAHYRRGIIDRLHLAPLFGPNGMMVLREIQRRPLKTLVSSLGIAGAVSLIVLGRFGLDSVNTYLEDVLRREQRQDLAVVFTRALGPRAVRTLAHEPGVLTAQGLRVVLVRARHEHRKRDVVLYALPENVTLRHFVERGGGEVKLPPRGVIVTKKLGEVLGVGLGDPVELELREGNRRVVHPTIVGLVDETVGLQIYAQGGVIASLEGDQGAVRAVLLRVDAHKRNAVIRQLRDSPYVMSILDLSEEIALQRKQHAAAFNVWTPVSVLMAVAVIFGVVYNNARISLTARARDLASLRVLGIRRREISSVLLGSLAIEVALAIPVGLVLGKLWADSMMSGIDQETFRWAGMVSFRTYALATGVTLLSALASALWVRRNLDRLDLIAVLKTRE